MATVRSTSPMLEDFGKPPAPTPVPQGGTVRSTVPALEDYGRVYGAPQISAGLSQDQINQMVADAVKAAMDGAAFTTVDPNRPPVTDAEVNAWVAEHYGYMSAYLNTPEVGDVIRKAARMGIKDQSQLFGMLYPTKWWQTTSDASRLWQAKVNTDPASAQAAVRAKSAEVTNAAGILGVKVDAADIAQRALSAGWDQNQLTDYLVGLTKGTNSFSEGQLGAYQSQVVNLAKQYMVQVDKGTAAEYARRIASGELDAQGVAALFQNYAKQRFTWMGSTIDAGLTPLDYFKPLQNTIASQLELNPSDVDPNDPHWLSLMEVRDPKTGLSRGATQTEVFDAARRDPRWWGTNNAQNTVANLGMGLMSKFGLV